MSNDRSSKGKNEPSSVKALEDTSKVAPKIAHEDPLAIALSYRPTQDQAPRIVAKGQGWVARQIMEIAEAQGIEVRKDADLAKILAQLDVDSEIPLEAFTLVAEILSYVYQKNQSWPGELVPNTGTKS